MLANSDYQTTRKWVGLRGFSNLLRKEYIAWWGTRRWLINAVLWPVLLCGLTAIILFAPNQEANAATHAALELGGGMVGYILSNGLSVFFEFGGPMLAIGTVVLAQDLIIGEKQSGLVEWLLSKPVTRRAYILAKVAGNVPPSLILLVGLPSILAYTMLSLRIGEGFPLAPFLLAVGTIVLHTVFYFTLTLMLGTIYNNRAAILGIPLASVLGGGLLGGFIQPLFAVTPWMLPKIAWLTSTSQAYPAEMAIFPLVATALWSVSFILVALVKFERLEF